MVDVLIHIALPLMPIFQTEIFEPVARTKIRNCLYLFVLTESRHT